MNVTEDPRKKKDDDPEAMGTAAIDVEPAAVNGTSDFLSMGTVS